MFVIRHTVVIKWEHFPRYWPFMRGIHRYPVKSPHKGQWRGALMFFLIGTRTSVWVNTRDAGDLTRHRAHYDVIVMGLGEGWVGLVTNWLVLIFKFGHSMLCCSSCHDTQTLSALLTICKENWNEGPVILSLTWTGCWKTVELPVNWNPTTLMQRHCKYLQLYLVSQTPFATINQGSNSLAFLNVYVYVDIHVYIYKHTPQNKI